MSNHMVIWDAWRGLSSLRHIRSPLQHVNCVTSTSQMKVTLMLKIPVIKSLEYMFEYLSIVAKKDNKLCEFVSYFTSLQISKYATEY